MSATGPSTLFPSVDRALFAAALTERLRAAGLRPALAATERFSQGLAIADPRTQTELYWVARACLVDDVDQLTAFDRVMAAVLGSVIPGLDPVSRRNGLPAPPARQDDAHASVRGERARLEGGGGVPWATRPPAAGDDDAGPDDDPATSLPELRPSDRERLADVPFDELDPDDLARIGAAIEQAARRWPTRRARRTRPARHGRTIDPRRTLRRSLRTAGEPIHLARVSHVRRPRRVVMLADVSGSMQTYVRAYLHLLRGLGRGVDAETFAFATRLTRITPELRHRDPRRAVALATEEVTDRYAGTRIASCLRELLRQPTWGATVRGAVVIIASDGWDSDPPDELDAQLRRLARMAERIVWVNPRLAAPGFTPSTAGMSTAVPHCDRLVSGHSLAAMDELFAALTDRHGGAHA